MNSTDYYAVLTVSKNKTKNKNNIATKLCFDWAL